MLILRYVPSRGRSRRAAAGREAFAARSHGQSPGCEMCVLQLRMTHRASIHVTGAELVAGDGGRAAEVRIMHRQVHVRKSRAPVQPTDAAPGVCSKTGNAEASAIPAPPGMEMVAWSKRKPANRAPETIAESKSETTAKSKEGNISRRPNRTVIRISVSRTGPPAPRSVVHHPATVVIRRPAPRIVRNPRPSPIRLIHPDRKSTRLNSSHLGISYAAFC